MDLSALSAISPIDGRYGDRLCELRPLFSEFGLIRQRVRVEIEWFKTLAGCAELTGGKPVEEEALRALDALVERFDEAHAARIKEIEGRTNHDVKAVEYYLRERLEEIPALRVHRELLHFACTSEDINNLAYALMIEEVRARVLLPVIDDLIEALRALAHRHADRAMLARTHGQAASPTTLGKEMAVFVSRLREQSGALARVAVRGKLNGAVGNYNTHCFACPDLDWPRITEAFVKDLGLEFNPRTTQIEPHDWMAELFHALMRFNTVLVDLCRDIWTYISLGYFRQRASEGEVGSSTMPHKINPIDFENAEGNLGIANALLSHLASKLPVSRLQRDLSDSTALRNVGTAIAHSMLACRSCLRGLARVAVDAAAMERDLEAAWEVLAEPIQTLLRLHGVEDAYERLKEATRGRAVDRDTLHRLILELEIPEEAKARLRALTPSAYIGYAERLAREI